MITQTGIVIKTDKSSAWIKTNRSTACKACEYNDTCGEHRSKELILTVKNTLKVEKGDHVIVGLKTKSMLQLAFFLYVFPVILLLVGALIGDKASGFFSISPSLGAIILGGFFFIIAFFIIRKSYSRLNQNDDYKPFLVKKTL